MNAPSKWYRRCVGALLLTLTLSGVTGFARPQSDRSKDPAAEAQTKARNPKISEADIAAAKAAGKVWVNTSTGVYHKSGQWYGKTKDGKFMTETEAKAAGYKGSKR